MVQSRFQKLFRNQDCDVVSNLLVEIAIYDFDLFHSLPLIGFQLASVTAFARVFDLRPIPTIPDLWFQSGTSRDVGAQISAYSSNLARRDLFSATQKVFPTNILFFLKNENILASKVVFRFKYHNGPMAALVGVLCRSWLAAPLMECGLQVNYNDQASSFSLPSPSIPRPFIIIIIFLVTIRICASKYMYIRVAKVFFHLKRFFSPVSLFFVEIFTMARRTEMLSSFAFWSVSTQSTTQSSALLGSVSEGYLVALVW